MELVIVESPTKAKTLSKFLGKKYEVKASMGHVRDLPTKELGVDVEKDFEPKYVTAPKAKKTLSDLKKSVKEAEKVYLATDPDREGEAIAWHLSESIFDKKAEKKKVERVVFHEITKEAVDEAFLHPRDIDLKLVDAQQARRVLDRVVGYKLSPLLWKKVRYGLSAGRVQSVAVRLIVDREIERKNFKPEEYWSLDAVFGLPKKVEYLGSLFEIASKKAVLSNEKQINEISDELKAYKEQFKVSSVEKTEKKRYAYPPFTTSTMTQTASNRLGFAAKRTMSAAQKLFEAGLITYHRTDSLNLAEAFLNQARKYIGGEYGEQFLPEKPNFYKNKSRNAQEAHEAVRPTNVYNFSPEELGVDEAKLYKLIWQRAVSSQMLPAIFDQTTIITNSPEDKYKFRTTGSKVKFEGWLKVYGKQVDDEETEEKEYEIPEVDEGAKADLNDLKPEQHFTQPPPRYTEASLIKALEEDGIGRPSTYAPTISTIESRGYVKKEGKYFVPQDVAMVVTKLLTDHFPKVVDLGFTALMEEDLDKIAEGEEQWVPVIKRFYDPFIKEIAEKEGELNKKDMTLLEETEEKCPECGKHINIKLGKYGRFKSCSGFPDCKYAEPILSPTVDNGEGFVLDESQLGKCPQCEDGVLALKDGRFGKFIACSNYPKCKFTKPYLEKIGVKCPTCGEGDVVVKKGGRFKKVFYGCSRYPDCKFVSNKDPRKAEEEAKEPKDQN